MPLLEVSNLTKHFMLGRQTVQIIKGVSFALKRGEILGLGGESGCGKSTLGKMILRLIEPSSGTVHFNGKELLKLSRADLREQRRHMQMVFQNPATSLNPKFTVKDILSEPLVVHSLKKDDEQLGQLLHQVNLDERYLQRYPHELSGGQKQRIAIARALALNPALIVCDEPFSALDVSVQLQIMQLLKKLQQELGLAYILISHDLSAMRSFTHRLAIMYLGQLVEIGPSEEVYARPRHPYTQALISAVPLPDPQLERKRKPIILKGEMPSLLQPPSGCPFHTRCPHATDVCREIAPKLREVGPQHFVACHLHNHGSF